MQEDPAYRAAVAAPTDCCLAVDDGGDIQQFDNGAFLRKGRRIDFPPDLPTKLFNLFGCVDVDLGLCQMLGQLTDFVLYFDPNLVDFVYLPVQPLYAVFAFGVQHSPTFALGVQFRQLILKSLQVFLIRPQASLGIGLSLAQSCKHTFRVLEHVNDSGPDQVIDFGHGKPAVAGARLPVVAVNGARSGDL
jgi:hypothetical protein